MTYLAGTSEDLAVWGFGEDCKNLYQSNSSFQKLANQIQDNKMPLLRPNKILQSYWSIEQILSSDSLKIPPRNSPTLLLTTKASQQDAFGATGQCIGHEVALTSGLNPVSPRHSFLCFCLKHMSY